MDSPGLGRRSSSSRIGSDTLAGTLRLMNPTRLIRHLSQQALYYSVYRTGAGCIGQTVAGIYVSQAKPTNVRSYLITELTFQIPVTELRFAYQIVY